jgi:Methyltransferase domain
LLSWAVRYFPILRIIKRRRLAGERLLEIGSGSFGLATFYQNQFVGCDVDFPWPPLKPMLPVRCSATTLPFGDASFGAVVASDVLEHVPPMHRLTVVREALRVAGKVAVFGFPSGSRAYESDRNFYQYHKQRRIPVCDWLEEHMRYPFPDRTLFDGLPPEWSVESFGNDQLWFHEWLNHRELSGKVNQLLSSVVRIVPRPVEALLKLADRSPFYRLIVVVSRNPREEGKLLIDPAA